MKQKLIDALSSMRSEDQCMCGCPPTNVRVALTLSLSLVSSLAKMAHLVGLHDGAGPAGGGGCVATLLRSL